MDNKSKNHIPSSIGVIIDGNRRYAREHGLPTMEGHRRGYAKIKDLVHWCKDAGVACVTVYAFSTENWNRSPEEVSYLVDIFRTMLISDTRELQKEGGAVKFIGEIERFGKDLAKDVQMLEAENPSHPTVTLVVALSYGGRLEIITAVNKLLAEGVPRVATEKEFLEHLWTKDIPDPDLIIRTGGEKRLSNFLPWQSIYSELFFTDTYWPAFDEKEFLNILKEFSSRERRRGR